MSSPNPNSNEDLSDIGGVEVHSDDLSDLGGHEIAHQIPSHENFLQKAIRAVVPQNSDEAGDVAKMAFRQLPMARGGDVNPATMGPFGAGLNLAGVNHMGGVPLQTDWGKTMERQVVDPGMIASAAVPLAGAGLRGIGSLFDVAGAKGAMSDVIQNSAEKVGGRIEEASQGANKAMGEQLGQVEDTGITQEHFNQALRDTADAIDPTRTTHAMPDSLANQVLSHVEETPAAEVDPATGAQAAPKTMSGPEVQAKTMQLTDALEHPVAKAEFYNQVSKILPDSMKDIKGARAVVYNAAEGAQPLTKIGNLNKIAKGTMGPQQLAKYQGAEKNLGGINIIEDLMNSGKKLNRARTAQSIGKIIGGSALGAGAGLEGYKIFKGINDLFGGRNSNEGQ